MQSNFDLVFNGISHTTNAMLECLKKGIQADTLGIFPNKKKINFLYPTFEIFSFLLFRLDYLLARYQEQKHREPLLHFIVGNMFKALHIKEDFFLRILNKRMAEYGDILCGKEEYAGIFYDKNLASEPREVAVVHCFLDNLAYSIFEKKLFDWEGRVKPIPVLDALKMSLIHTTHREMLLPVEVKFLIITKSLFAANPDFTQLSTKELENIQKTNEEEIRKIGL